MTTSLRSSTGLLIFCLGLIIGANFPDFDQQFSPFLIHRSILTHSWFLPAFLLIVARFTGHRDDWHAVVAGLCIGIAVHLAFDLFPRQWQGYALITLPFPFAVRTDGTFSWLWIASSILVCIAIAAALTSRDQRMLLTVASLGAFIWCAPGEQSLLGAALALGIALGLALWGPGWIGRRSTYGVRPRGCSRKRPIRTTESKPKATFGRDLIWHAANSSRRKTTSPVGSQSHQSQPNMGTRKSQSKTRVTSPTAM